GRRAARGATRSASALLPVQYCVASVLFITRFLQSPIHAECVLDFFIYQIQLLAAWCPLWHARYRHGIAGISCRSNSMRVGTDGRKIPQAAERGPIGSLEHAQE